MLKKTEEMLKDLNRELESAKLIDIFKLKNIISRSKNSLGRLQSKLDM